MYRNITRYLLVVALLLPSVAQAMPFSQFDAMAAEDRQAYLELMVECAQKAMINEGHRDVAAKIYQLFNEIHPGDGLPMGEAEFEANLDNARVLDAKRYAQDHSVQRLNVEVALAATLKKNGFILTPEFFKEFNQMLSNFKPKSPPQSK